MTKGRRGAFLEENGAKMYSDLAENSRPKGQNEGTLLHFSTLLLMPARALSVAAVALALAWINQAQRDLPRQSAELKQAVSTLWGGACG